MEVWATRGRSNTYPKIEGLSVGNRRFFSNGGDECLDARTTTAYLKIVFTDGSHA